MLTKFETARTTVTIPTELLERSQRFINSGVAPNRNALIVAALEHFLNELERREIDAQFKAMAEDDSYQEMNRQLAEDFVESDWEALSSETTSEEEV